MKSSRVARVGSSWSNSHYTESIVTLGRSLESRIFNCHCAEVRSELEDVRCTQGSGVR